MPTEREAVVPALKWKRTSKHEMFLAACDHGAGHDAIWIDHQTEAAFPDGQHSVSCEHEVFCLLGIDAIRFIENRLGETLTAEQTDFLLRLYGRAG